MCAGPIGCCSAHTCSRHTGQLHGLFRFYIEVDLGTRWPMFSCDACTAHHMQRGLKATAAHQQAHPMTGGRVACGITGLQTKAACHTLLRQSQPDGSS